MSVGPVRLLVLLLCIPVLCIGPVRLFVLLPPCSPVLCIGPVRSCLPPGEEPDSYGYGGTGKFSTNCKFSNFGERFGKGDIIMALLDLDCQQPSMSYARNGVWLGVAHTVQDWRPGSKDAALFPHILTKNCRWVVGVVLVVMMMYSHWVGRLPGFSFI